MVMKTPGVYIVEKDAFPNSVVQVATAVPAFIGYTQKAMNGSVSLHETPKRLTSMADYHKYFGGAPDPKFKIVPLEERDGPSPLSSEGSALPPELPVAEFTATSPTASEKYELVQVSKAFALFGAMQLFFLNGGGDCYVTSIGTYDMDETDINADAMLRAIDRLKKEPEPTLLVIPETTRLARQEAAKIHKAMLKHCGTDMGHRFAILDISGGYLDQTSPRGDPIEVFRNDIGVDDLGYAAAYYPWLESTVFQSRDFTFDNIEWSSRTTFIDLLKRSVSNAAELVPEIERIGTPVLSGDFTISVPSGATVVLTAGDVSAQDEGSSAAPLIYQIYGDAQGMSGKLVASGTKDPALTRFTQQDLETGQVSFIHDPALGTSGHFDLVVTDETGNTTNAHKIAVVVGTAVLKLEDVQRGKTIVIDFPKNHSGSNPDSVMLLGADMEDHAAAIAADATTKKNADDVVTPSINAVPGKTKTVPGVGVWSVGDAGKVTFAPIADFKGPSATVSYTIAIGGTVQAPSEIKILLDGGETGKADNAALTATVDKTMRAVTPLYSHVMDAIAKYMNAMPPAAAMAGVYTAVDASRGVWKAPANVSINSVVEPMVNIAHAEQENLNVSTTGKSINAIRPFTGEGTLVWGARTLDGNSLDWRYINIRRTMIMLEQSIRLATNAYMFEPNTENTWVTMRSMIENYLTGVWKEGGLAGSVPTDAFSVRIGLGETMTPKDILEGVLRISILLAVSRPAEFMEVTFQQQMQKS